MGRQAWHWYKNQLNLRTIQEKAHSYFYNKFNYRDRFVSILCYIHTSLSKISTLHPFLPMHFWHWLSTPFHKHFEYQGRNSTWNKVGFEQEIHRTVCAEWRSKGTSLFCYLSWKISLKTQLFSCTSQKKPAAHASLNAITQTSWTKRKEKTTRTAPLSVCLYSGSVTEESPKREVPYKALGNSMVLTSLCILKHVDKLWDIGCKFLLKVNKFN